MTENVFQNLVLQLAKNLGVLTYHTYDSRKSVPGFPDLVIVGQNGVLWRELKTKTGKTTPAQDRWLEALRAAGQDADVWRPVDWPVRIHQEIQRLGRCQIAAPVPSQAEIRRKLARRVSGTSNFPPSP